MPCRKGNQLDNLMSEDLIPDAELCLASGSKQRLALLGQLGLKCLVRPMDIDESVIPGEAPADYVHRLDLEKARQAYAQSDGSLPVLGADTTVCINGNILGKPEDTEHASAMLLSLSGTTHQVYTGAGIVWQGGEQSTVVTTAVTFANLNAALLRDYIATGEPFGKAGAYAIQGRGAALVERIEGSYSNVVGLPLYETAALLCSAGIAILKPDIKR